jgi:uncharacterized membrane protein YgcG
MANYTVKLPDFLGNDGYNGPNEAENFFQDVADAQLAGNVPNARMAGLVRTVLKGNARRWYQIQRDGGVAGLGEWTTLEPLMRARWIRPLTVLEVRRMMDGLQQLPDESVDAFRDRVQMAHINEDRTLAQAVKNEDGYMTNVNRRVRRAYLAGLRQEVRAAMVGVDPDVALIDEMVVLARNAELLTRQAATRQTVNVVTNAAYDVDLPPREYPGLSLEDQATVDAVYSRYPPRGGGGRGGGQSRGGGGNRRGGGSQGGNPHADKSCRRCGLLGHLEAKCIVNLDNLKRRGKGKFARGGGVSAAAAASTPAPNAGGGDYQETEDYSEN